MFRCWKKSAKVATWLGLRNGRPMRIPYACISMGTSSTINYTMMGRILSEKRGNDPSKKSIFLTLIFILFFALLWPKIDHFNPKNYEESIQIWAFLFAYFRFETLDLLVADGLISMFVDKHASDYIRKMADEAIYEQSPYSQYHRNAEQFQRVKAPAARCHNFAQYTWKMPHYCDYCRNFLWGLVQQVRRWKDSLQFVNVGPQLMTERIRSEWFDANLMCPINFSSHSKRSHHHITWFCPSFNAFAFKRISFRASDAKTVDLRRIRNAATSLGTIAYPRLST